MYELYPGEPDENKIYLDSELREILVNAHYPLEIVDTLVEYKLAGACEVIFDAEGDLMESSYELPLHGPTTGTLDI